jgi:hypothetical protein
VVTYGWSFACGLLITLAVAGVASLPGCEVLGVLLLPGALIGGIFIPQGINSGFVAAYMTIAAIANAFVLSWPLLGLWMLLTRSRRRTTNKGAAR